MKSSYTAIKIKIYIMAPVIKIEQISQPVKENLVGESGGKSLLYDYPRCRENLISQQIYCNSIKKLKKNSARFCNLGWREMNEYRMGSELTGPSGPPSKSTT